MHIATIQVAAITPPAMGKKRGKIQAADGTVYQIDPAMATGIQIGGTYNINYKDDSFNGFNFKVIEKVSGAAGGSAPQQQATSAAAPMRAAGNDELPERIFVCGALNAMLSNPQAEGHTMTEDQIVVMVNTLRKAFARTFGKKPAAKDEMNDEIPF